MLMMMVGVLAGDCHHHHFGAVIGDSMVEQPTLRHPKKQQWPDGYVPFLPHGNEGQR